MTPREQKLRIMGVHLGGSATKKTAVVRASVQVKRLLSGIPEGVNHDLFSNALKAYFPDLNIEPERPGQNTGQTSEGGSSPLFWEAFSAEIGPSSHQDSDARFFDVVSDLGGADVFCIDAPLTLPPCLSCPPECAKTFPCSSRAADFMRAIWEEKRKNDKRARPPLPYIDRYFEVYARNTFEHPGYSGSFEIESAMGSNRAPLTARAICLARQLKQRYPKALIVETNSIVAALGWSLHSGYKIDSLLSLKSSQFGRSARAGLLKKLEQKRFATRSANLHEDLFTEYASQVEVFLAAMGALSAWGLLNGEILITKEFLTVEAGSPLQGWACVPKDVAQYAWGH